MSYDLYLFRLKDGITVERINELLSSGEFYDAMDEMEAKSDDFNSLGYFAEQFADTSLDYDDLVKLATKPYLRAFWDCEGEPTHEMLEDVENMFEYVEDCALLPLIVSYGGDLAAYSSKVVAMTKTDEFRSENLAIFDPQSDSVFNHENAEEVMGTSVQQSAEFFESVMQSYQPGGNQLDPELFEQIGELLKEADRLAPEGDFERLRKLFQQAADLIPEPKTKWFGSHVPFLALGQIDEILDNTDSAIRNLRIAAECEGADAEVLLNLGRLLYTSGEADEGTAYLQQAYQTGGEELFADEDEYLLKIAKG